MDSYTYEEQVDMVLVYGQCQCNGRESVRAYREKFPNRRVPNHQTFGNIVRRLRETGSLKPKHSDRGRQRTRLTVELEERILERVEEDPKISTRRLGHQLEVSKDVIHTVIKEQLLHPYHLQKVQELLPLDYEARLTFCQFIQSQRIRDPDFSKSILFTDEATFTRCGITNVHNDHVYAEENPHMTTAVHHQHQFKINVWAGIIDDCIIGPAIIPNNLNGEVYLNFLRETLPELLENLPLLVRRDMWYMQDGAPPHFALAVRQHLHQTYPDRWIGRGADAPIKWPARSPDLTPCDYFLWGALKSKVYASAINSEEELRRKIFLAFESLNNPETINRVQFNFMRRVNLCIEKNGGHFEQFL